ncbi:uncharacterized protein L199_000393 [Kwoniella botswanensis]|uniref:uncharacterized protein n=1 Tax=Kwoniella botswanensis TaxID=1268659 RepID=UPI00315D6632
MSSPPPPNNNDNHNDQSPPSAEANQTQNNDRTQSRHSPLPSISFSISIPRPAHSPAPRPGAADGPDQNLNENQNQQPSAEGSGAQPNGVAPLGSSAGSSFFWTFTIRPDDGPAPGPSTNPSDAPGGNTSTNPPEGTSSEEGSGGQAQSQQQQRMTLPQAPPWIFPPFLNFFLPLRTEPQPNPEKAAELLRSLPTVGRRLLMRVDRIVAAQETDVLPEEKGWKCGVCLEGLNAEEEDEQDKGKQKEGSSDMKVDGNAKEQKGNLKEQKNRTGVKALPCNHLFHEKCLQPWFTTKHTCPSCRLDLDPLQTLNSPSTHTNTTRPGQTGSGRRSPHPYSRDRPANAPTATENTATTEGNAAQDRTAGGNTHLNPFIPSSGLFPSVGISGSGLPEEDDRPSITFIFSGSPPPGLNLPGMPPRPDIQFNNSTTPQAQSTNTATSEQQPAAENRGSGTNNPDSAQPAPSTPGSGSVFDVPTFFSSPLPMGSRASPSPAPDLPPLVNPVPHIASASVPPPSSSQLNASPSIPSPAASTIANTTAEGDRPRPERRPHITIIRRTSPSPAPGPGGLPPPGGLGLGNLPLPPFLFPTMPPGFLGPHPNLPGQGQGGAPATQNAAGSSPASAPFVPQSLESWTEEREKSLGWRCDAVECIYAPPTAEDDEDVDMTPEEEHEGEEGDKEMLSIYSTLQPPLTDEQKQEEQKDGSGKFVLLACQHKWHRKCIELSERSCGRLHDREGEDGRVWVRCEKCRKDGWVKTRTKSTDNSMTEMKESEERQNKDDQDEDEDDGYAPSEREVENLVNC